MMARVARALDRTAEFSRYRDLFQRIQTAFQEQLVSADGRVLGETQTAYAMALDSGLIPKELRTAAVEHLVEEIENNDWHLSTGFVGTACILPALCDEGRTDVAYRLVTQTTYPSWGFELEHGATSIWEHWDSWRPEAGFHDPKMNSLNHVIRSPRWAHGCTGMQRESIQIQSDQVTDAFFSVRTPTPWWGTCRHRSSQWRAASRARGRWTASVSVSRSKYPQTASVCSRHRG